MSKIAESELIVNPDGSVYHLNLKAGDISDKIIGFTSSRYSSYFSINSFSLDWIMLPKKKMFFGKLPGGRRGITASNENIIDKANDPIISKVIKFE